jgi:nucleoid DNA-binding protein
MIPKKARSLYKQVSEELDISESLVEDFVEFVYKNLRHNLSNLTHPRINMPGLGHFMAKPLTIRKAIPRYTRNLENHDTSTFGAYYNKKQVEDKLAKLIELEKKISAQDEKKQEFKKLKNGNTQGDMEK